MGRVSKYKKIKAVDPFSKKNKGKAAISSRTSDYVWGSGDNGRREKKRSIKAQRHQERKLEGASDGRRRAREAAGAGGFDLPPSGKDDFDLADLVGSVRRQKRPRIDDGLADTRRRTEAVSRKSKGGDAASAQPTPSIPETDAEEKRVARILKLSKNSKSGGVGTSGAGGKGGSGKSAASSSSLPMPTTKKGSKSQISGRREGESMRAFERRVKEETRLILLEQASESKLVSKEKVAKKKEFLKSLKSKKKNRKGGGGTGGGRPRSGTSDDEYGSDDGYGRGGGGGLVTGERAVAAASRAAASTGSAIHDQVERPPTFELLPRGAKRKATNKEKEGGKLGMDEQKRRAEQRAMDNLRLKVQAQYNVIKQKRKRAGDFHL